MRYHFVALFTILVWGLTFVSTKVLLVDFTPLQILAIRFAIGTLALCALRPHVMHLRERRHEWFFVFAGATGIAAYYLLENIALMFTTATAVGVIVAASPLFTAIIAMTCGDRSALNARFVIGFLLAMGGLVLVGVSTGGEDTLSAFGGLSYFGDLLALLAAVVWAVYSMLVKRIGELGYETIASTKRTFLWGLVFIIPASVLFGGDLPTVREALAWDNVANLLFLGIAASAACFVTWNVAVRRLGAVVSTTYIYLVPAITVTASIILLGEPLTVPIVTGLVLTIAGLVLSQRGQAGREV